MKKILIVLTVALLAAGGLSAQAKGNGDIKVFGIELGTGFNYDLDAKTSNATQTVSAVFGLSDVVQAGFTVIKGDVTAPTAGLHNFALVKLVVFPINDVAVNLLFGGNAEASPKIASGFGVGYNVFKNTSGALTTALQGSIQYLFTSDIAKGNLGVGLNVKVGL